MILFFMFIITYGQKLMIDSRGSPIKSKELNSFDQEFSIWFTYQLTADQFGEDLFMIVHNNNYLLRIQPEMMKMLIIFNKDQILIDFEYLKEPILWFHIIVSQNQNFQNEFFFIDFREPFTQHMQINVDEPNVLVNQTSIITTFNSNFFCLIYDSITKEIQPKIRSTNMQQLIVPLEIRLYQYRTNSLFEVFLKKYMDNFKTSILLSIFYQERNLFEIQEKDDILEILAFEQDKIQGRYQTYKWFIIYIDFHQNQIEIDVLFVDQHHFIKIANANTKEIFYDVSLYTENSNYQYMKFTEYFNVGHISLTNQQGLQSLNDCQIGLNKYYIFENNTCGDFIDLEQIQIIPAPQEQYDINSFFDGVFQNQQIGEAIQKQLITRVSNYANIPLLRQKEILNILKEPFIYWKNQQYSVCMQNYFGKHCNQFINNCLVAQNKKCIYCQNGNVLIQSQCKNCTFNLLKSTILFVQIMEIKIRLIDIQINLLEMGINFKFDGLDIQVYVENLQISYLNQFSNNNDNYLLCIFEIQFTKLFINNLIEKNLTQTLIFSSQSSIIIQNSEFINFNRQNRLDDMYLICIYDSSLIISQSKLLQITNFYGIFYINGFSLIYFQFIQVQNVIAANFFMKLEQSQQNAKIIIRDIYIKQLHGKEVFGFYFKEKSSIIINNLYFIQSDNFDNNGNLNEFLLNNSLINQITNFSFQQAKFQLLNSEIIFNQSLKFKQIQLHHSLLRDMMASERVYRTSFLLTLSFNKGSNLKQIKKQTSDQITSEIQSSEYYFYIPSGQKLSEYKRLNLKTLQYQQIYEGFYILTQGFLFGQTGYTLQCNQFQYYNGIPIENDNSFQNFIIVTGFNDISDYIFIVNPHNHNNTVFKIVCSSNLNKQIIQLLYSVKAFPFQLGEYFYQYQCLECNLKQNQYSVIYNATNCNFVDQGIQSIKKGLIKLQQQYWRYKYNSHIIEYCSSNYCNGGWIPGDQSCNTSRVGALCMECDLPGDQSCNTSRVGALCMECDLPGDQSCNTSRVGALCMECDLYNIKGEGFYTKSNQNCEFCQEFYLKLLFQLVCAFFWQLLMVLSGYNSNNKLSKQYLMFRVGFRQFYQLLYRQSIDQPMILIKIFINYIFMLYIIRQSLDLNGFIFVSNINPGLVLQAQLDCFLSRYLKLKIIYSQYLFQLLLVCFILSLTYVIYFIILYLKLRKHQLGLILYVTEGLIIYNIKIILDISCQLLSYTIASGQKWIKQNKQYLFYSEEHISMIYYIIPVSAILFVTPLIIPFAMKNLSIFNRQAKRIYAVYYQQFKNEFFYWEYIILYIKYALTIFQIIDNQSNQLNVVIIWLLTIFSLNYKPYYLRNLNYFELNLLAFYGIQLSFLKMDDFKDFSVLVCNLFIFSFFMIKMYNCHNLVNLEKKIYWRQKLITFLPVIRYFSGVDRYSRQKINRQMLLNLINTMILKKQKIQFINKQRLMTENEIELSAMLNIQQTQSIYPSRQEPLN